MSLSEFIEANMDGILAEWETFARRNAPPASEMTDLALRDHARQIMEAVARDLASLQSDAQSFAKSQGDSDATTGQRTAATIHGALRHGNDFSLLQLSAEFRALRATVLRLWLPGVGEVTDAVLDDMVRFNEAIDQALAQSIIAYSGRADLTRDLFLAVLGHDLRAPLSNVSMIGELLIRGRMPADTVQELGMRAVRSARFMRHMVDDLLSYTRVQMGRGIPTSPTDCDIAEVVRTAVADATATYPQGRFDVTTAGHTVGHADGGRLQQLFTNLLVNAVQHGEPGHAVRVSVAGDADAITVCVSNRGRVLSDEQCELIFRPLVQLPGDSDGDTRSTSLGLGLYIAREIAHAHAGSIRVTSREGGTTFETTLPRNTV